MDKIKKLTKEDISKYKDHLTVGALKEFLSKHKLSDDSIVLIQRVEDLYYNECNWGVYLKKGDHTHQVEQRNKDIKSGKYLDKEKYPKIKPKHLIPSTKDEVKESMEQYHPAWSCVRYSDDKNILFIDLHY